MQPILFPLAGFNLNLASHQRRGVHPPMLGRVPLPTAILNIAGVSRDNTGAALANCDCFLYRTLDDVMVEKVVSDANGNYSFSTVGLAQNYYVRWYKSGSPDRTGASLNTLIGT